MQHMSPLILDLAIILGVAAVVTLIFQKIRQPVVLGYLVAGIIVGPYTPPYALISDVPNIQTLSELGIIFLMFSLGLDFTFEKLSRVGFSGSLIAIFEVMVMVVIGFGTGKLLGWNFYDALFLGAALSISSTTIIIKAVGELGLLKKPFAELMFGVLIVEDLVAILLLVILTSWVRAHHLLSIEILHSLYQLVLTVGGWFIFGYFLIPALLHRVMRYASDETLTVLCVGLCLFLVAVAAYFNYSTALGAFIMGSIIAETPSAHHIEQLIQPIKNIFAAIFFVSIGMLVDPHVIIVHWQAVLIITLLTIIGKLTVTALGAMLTGQNLKTSLRVGFGMAQVGEFSFIIAGLGVSLGVTSGFLYPLIVAVSCITAFTTPYLIRLSQLLSPQLAQFYHMKEEEPLPSTFKKTLIRFLMNSLIITIIFTLFNKLPIVKIAAWLMGLIMALPFLWGMFFASRPANHWLARIYYWFEGRLLKNLKRDS